MIKSALISSMALFFCMGTASAQQVVDVHSHNILPAQTDSLKGIKMTSENYAGDMLVRISEIEVYPQYLEEYLKFALTVGATSVREEPGVIAIYPMIQQRDSCQIRILEIYASQEAYRHHIGTEHFQIYKQGTLHMVKRLDLVDMNPMNPAAMPEIFRKLNPKTNE